MEGRPDLSAAVRALSSDCLTARVSQRAVGGRERRCRLGLGAWLRAAGDRQPGVGFWRDQVRRRRSHDRPAVLVGLSRRTGRCARIIHPADPTAAYERARNDGDALAGYSNDPLCLDRRVLLLNRQRQPWSGRAAAAWAWRPGLATLDDRRSRASRPGVHPLLYAAAPPGGAVAAAPAATCCQHAADRRADPGHDLLHPEPRSLDRRRRGAVRLLHGPAGAGMAAGARPGHATRRVMA